MLNKNKKPQKGFTIVELLIVVVVIAILAAIVIVAYNGITRRAEVAALQSDLRNTAAKLHLNKTDNGDSYIAALNAETTVKGSTTELTYTRLSATAFCLSAASTKTPNLVFYITQEGMINNGYCTGHGPVAGTSPSCFAFNAGTQTITAYYTHENNNTANSACPNDVTIPVSIYGTPVTVIGNSAFSNKSSLTSVTIANTVTSIGTLAFGSSRNLQAINIPNSVATIGYGAFMYTALTSLTLPSSLTTIPDNMAYETRTLQSVTIPNSVATIGVSAFKNTGLTSISIPTSVKVIKAGAFTGSQLPDSQAFIYERNSDGSSNTSVLVSYGGAKRSNVIIPNNVTVISYDAFYNADIESVTLPSNLTQIMGGAFNTNALTSITIPSTIQTLQPGAFEGNSITSVALPEYLYISDSVFDSGVVITRY